jgi:iron complex outermembrane receptor protein
LPETFLKDSGAQQLADVVNAVPGLAFTQNVQGQANLAIRGVQTGSTYSNVQSPVALYYDEVPVLDPYTPWQVPQLNLFDINRVEVLEGPQGTLFGAGALGGAIRVITNKPNLYRYDAATEDTVETTQGGAAGYLTNLMVNLPIVSDKLAVRAVGYYDSYGGWIKNSTMDAKNTNRGDLYGGRAEIEWAPTDKLNFIATISNERSQPRDASYEPYGSTNYTATNALRQYNVDNTTIYSIAATYSMPWATLTSSTSYLNRVAWLQRDFTSISSSATGLPSLSPLIDSSKSGDFIQEVRLASVEDHPYRWLIGGFFENYHLVAPETIYQAGVAARFGTPSNFLEAERSGAKIVDQAVFGEVAYDLLPRLTLTIGGRYSSYSVATDTSTAIYGVDIGEGAPKSFSRPTQYSAVTPKFNLSYNISPNVMVYGLIDEGYTEGESNLVPAVDPISHQPIPASYSPEKLWNYELGAKTAFFEHKLVLNADVYYIDFSNIQLQQQTVSYFYVGNAGKARSEGVEAQLTARPLPPLEIGASMSYNDAKLLSVLPGTQATPGDQLPGSAKFNSYVYAQYKYALPNGVEFAARANYSYIGREYSYLDNHDNPAALTYGNYGNVDAQASLSFSRYEIQLFVRNLTDGKARVAAATLFPGATEILETPRTVGLTFRAHL